MTRGFGVPASVASSGDVTAAITAHDVATDPHGDRSYADTQVAAKPSLSSSAASTSAVGDSATTGVGTTAARADHKHAREAFATPGSSAVGDSAGAGSAVTLARSDHRHGREAFSATLPLVASSTGSVGAAATPARSDHVHPVKALGPADHNLIAWNFVPYAATSTALAPASGTVYLMKVPIPVATTITNVIVGINAPGLNLVSGQNFLGLYSSAKALLSATADQTTSWGSLSGPAVVALTTPQAVSAGYVYVAYLSNFTSTGPAPSLNRAGGNINNVGLTATTAAFATGGTAQTSMPSTVTTTSYTAASIWAAVS